jgi:hypothetical protein
MPGFNVVDEVSQSLVGVLQDALTGLSATVVTDDLQSAPQNTLRLTVFLFEAGEDPSARNRPRVRELSAPDMRISKPPMALLLRYLLTPWGGTESARHAIIGRAMQVLYDRPILSGAQLVGSLAAEDQALKVTLAPLSLEERTRVWYAVQKPYRLSVSYEVRVVNLDTEVSDRVRPVRQRTLDVAVPEVSA